MRTYAAAALFSLAVGYALAHFSVLFYNHWYFAGYFWLKTALLTPALAVAYFAVLLGSWRTLWAALGCWWIGCYGVAAYYAGGMDLRPWGSPAYSTWRRPMSGPRRWGWPFTQPGARRPRGASQHGGSG